MSQFEGIQARKTPLAWGRVGLYFSIQAFYLFFYPSNGLGEATTKTGHLLYSV